MYSVIQKSVPEFNYNLGCMVVWCINTNISTKMIIVLPTVPNTFLLTNLPVKPKQTLNKLNLGSGVKIQIN